MATGLSMRIVRGQRRSRNLHVKAGPLTTLVGPRGTMGSRSQSQQDRQTAREAPLAPWQCALMARRIPRTPSAWALRLR